MSTSVGAYNGSYPYQGEGGGVNIKIMNLGPGGGVKFFKFIANFQIGMGYQILGGCLNF